MESLHQFLNEQAAACKERAAALTADDRRDEAVFEKIRGNVFEIFSAVLNTAKNQPEPMVFFRRQLDGFSVSCDSHGDDSPFCFAVCRLFWYWYTGFSGFV